MIAVDWASLRQLSSTSDTPGSAPEKHFWFAATSNNFSVINWSYPPKFPGCIHPVGETVG